jgi:hypothetical protein
MITQLEIDRVVPYNVLIVDKVTGSSIVVPSLQHAVSALRTDIPSLKQYVMDHQPYFLNRFIVKTNIDINAISNEDHFYGKVSYIILDLMTLQITIVDGPYAVSEITGIIPPLVEIYTDKGKSKIANGYLICNITTAFSGERYSLEFIEQSKVDYRGDLFDYLLSLTPTEDFDDFSVRAFQNLCVKSSTPSISDTDEIMSLMTDYELRGVLVSSVYHTLSSALNSEQRDTVETTIKALSPSFKNVHDESVPLSKLLEENIDPVKLQRARLSTPRISKIPHTSNHIEIKKDIPVSRVNRRVKK